MGSKLVKSETVDSPILQYRKNPYDMNRNSTPISHLEHNNQPKNVWKKRFLNTYTYNLCDPRSPGPELNRTPLVIEDNPEKNFNLNDTFADLLAEPKAKVNLKTVLQSNDTAQEQEAESLGMNDNAVTNCKKSDEEKILIVPTPYQPKLAHISQQVIDPRSPSIGVERTPIIFDIDNDYDDAMEDAMLENILSTLSLSMTNNVSITSAASTNSVNANAESFTSCNNDTKSPVQIDNVNQDLKPKHSVSRHNIYEDEENDSAEVKSRIPAENSRNDRTPLSCVHNRPRSRSQEQYGKSQNRTSKSLFKTTKENMSVLNI